MNDAPDEEIKAAIAGAREKRFKMAKRIAIPYKLLEKRYDPVTAYNVAMFLEELGRTVVNKPSLPPRYVRLTLFCLNLTTPVTI